MSQPIELDSVDRKILRALQKNARVTNKELAEISGVAASTCLSRVKRLRETGVIQGFSAVVDEEKLGRPVEAFLAVRMNPHRQALVEPFIRHTLMRPEVREICHLTGPDDFLVRVSAESVGALQTLVLEHFAARNEVAFVHTNLIFQKWRGGPADPAAPGA
ncbi:Lrp/AsnC family transcriptional regulator [Nocardiopsis sediminis]|uniref:Lrp/AsnC family transcriptional regulator n=1 Tax=Nocardiopsis sediminis TaxID=1778267 RepID=A0ABV8FJG4_9ACTN